MGKSIYSLVLNDEIIELLDNVAYKKGVSRSTLVNSVLADYVGYITPQKRLESLFSLIDELIISENRMRLEPPKSDSGFSIISALNYKYSPRITYSVEIGGADCFGYLTIQYRTSNAGLIETIASFFTKFIAIEKKYLGSSVEYSIRDGKLRRSMRSLDVSSPDELANEIMSYVATLDKLLNYYIQDDYQLRDKNLEERYATMMKSQI